VSFASRMVRFESAVSKETRRRGDIVGASRANTACIAATLRAFERAAVSDQSASGRPQPLQDALRA